MKHWAFDLDNTLIHSFPHYLESLETVLSQRGHTLGAPPIHELASQPARKILGRFLPESALDEALDQLRIIALEETDRVPPFDGAHDLLSYLSRTADSVSIWTNRDRPTTDAVLKDSGLGQYISHTVTAHCVSQPKPSPEGLYLLADRLQVQPSDIIMVGDHDFDILAGKSGGARTFRAGWSVLVEERCKIADQHFDSIPELLTWIQNQTSGT